MQRLRRGSGCLGVCCPKAEQVEIHELCSKCTEAEQHPEGCVAYKGLD